MTSTVVKSSLALSRSLIQLFIKKSACSKLDNQKSLFQVYKDQSSLAEQREAAEKQLESTEKVKGDLERKIRELSLQIVHLEELLQITQDKIKEHSQKWEKERQKLVSDNMRYCQVLTEKLESERKKSTELEQLSEALMKNIRSASEKEIELGGPFGHFML